MNPFQVFHTSSRCTFRKKIVSKQLDYLNTRMREYKYTLYLYFHHIILHISLHLHLPICIHMYWCVSIHPRMHWYIRSCINIWRVDVDVSEDGNIHIGHISLGECYERLINSSSSLRLWARAGTHRRYISLCGCHERLWHFSSSLKV